MARREYAPLKAPTELGDVHYAEQPVDRVALALDLARQRGAADQQSLVKLVLHNGTQPHQSLILLTIIGKLLALVDLLHYLRQVVGVLLQNLVQSC